MKECPFARKPCGDWCQLFENNACVLQSINSYLSMNQGVLQDIRDTEKDIWKKLPG